METQVSAGAKSSLRRSGIVQLRARNTELFKHHRNAIVDPVDGGLIGSDKCFIEWFVNTRAIKVTHATRANALVQVGQLLGWQHLDRDLGHRAAQDLENMAVNAHE